MKLHQFDYDLPAELVAQEPLENRSDSNLLGFDQTLEQCITMPFSSVGQFLRPGDLIIVNDTKVVPARILAHKPSGGKVEIMLERLLQRNTAMVQLRANKPVKIGQELCIENYLVTVIERQHRFFILQFNDDVNVEAMFEQFGKIPLPPYIRREPSAGDKIRYQTVYSRSPGAVAAPTAGLHFNSTLIGELKEAGVLWASITLHVGAGTYLPMQGEEITSHRMHHERIVVDQAVCELIGKVKASGGRIIAVGTTVIRALEAAALSGTLAPLSGETNLFITPGFKFNVVDVLITNFHLPRSTLLVLVSAFAGYHRIMQMYQYAIKNRFRFFSYGDAMILERLNEV